MNDIAYDDGLPVYDGKKRVYVSLTQKKGKEVACAAFLESSFEAAMDLMMPKYGGLDLQPHDEVMAKIKSHQEVLEAAAVGARIEGICNTIEVRELDCDEYSCLDLEILENGF